MTNTYNWSHRKLTDQQAKDARKRYAAGGVSMIQLAVEYNCSPTCIHRIVRNKSYRYPNPLKK